MRKKVGLKSDFSNMGWDFRAQLGHPEKKVTRLLKQKKKKLGSSLDSPDPFTSLTFFQFLSPSTWDHLHVYQRKF